MDSSCGLRGKLLEAFLADGICVGPIRIPQGWGDGEVVAGMQRDRLRHNLRIGLDFHESPIDPIEMP
jgi:hypothetical protein